MNLNTICEGCLSADRKLNVINNDFKEIFTRFLIGSETINNPLALCWECTAIINKIFRYKQQVQHAHMQLISFMLDQTKLMSCLSKLMTQTNTHESHIKLQSNEFNKQEKKEFSHSQTTATNTLHCGKGYEEKDGREQASYNCCVVQEKSEKVRENGQEREPVFIKVENEEDNNFEQELDFYGNNELIDDVDKDFKGVTLKSEQCIEGKETIIRTVLEFNESDDEPLTKKKESKQKTRKKKTEKGGGSVKSADKALSRLGLPRGTLQPVTLTWQQVEEERQKVLASESYLRYPHRCDHCAVGFNHSSKLENHMRKHQPSAGELVCTVCKVRCQTQHALTAHRRRHRIRWRCCLCGELASRASVVADHAARAHHAPTPTHTCNICGHTDTTLSKLRNHLKSHAERQKCELCGKTFRDKSTLNTHLFIHKGEKEHACPTCGKLFLFKKAMQLHAATHDAPALLYCHQCDMNFKNQMSYYQHMKYNLKHVDPSRLKYSCNVCGKKFMKASRLAEHNTALHLKLTPVRCPEQACNFSCASRPVLRAHARAVHRRVRAARNHVCHSCGKAYTNKKTLEGHLRAHSGERPFACNKCEATFGYEAALYNHNRLVHLKHKISRRPATVVEVSPSWPVNSAATDQNTQLL